MRRRAARRSTASRFPERPSTVGTTVGLDGTVYVPTIVGGLLAFRAAEEE